MGPIFENIKKSDVLAAFDAILTAIKNFFGWIGILVMPEEGEVKVTE